MSKDQIDRQYDREEQRLCVAYNNGEISQADYNAEMRELQRDARDSYAQGMDEDLQRVRDDWS